MGHMLEASKKWIAAGFLAGAFGWSLPASASASSWVPVEQDRVFSFQNCSCVSAGSLNCGSALDIRSSYGPSTQGSSLKDSAYGPGDYLVLQPVLVGSEQSLSYVKLSKSEFDRKSSPLQEKSWFYSAFAQSSRDVRKDFGRFVAGLEGGSGIWPDSRVRWAPQVKADLRMAGRFDIDFIGGVGTEVHAGGLKREMRSYFVNSLSSTRVGTVTRQDVTFDRGEVVGYRLEILTQGMDQADIGNARAQAAWRVMKAGIWSSTSPASESSSLLLECHK
jgi:hypothetical protein